jgi:hypothetical protein
MTISDAIGDSLLQIANFSNQKYQIRCPFPKPALEMTCKDENIARICETIILNAINYSSRGKFQYRIWSETNKVYLISYRSTDNIGSTIDRAYLSELSGKIVSYLLTNVSNWVINNEEASINLKKQLKNSEELTVFEHDNIGIDMANLFGRFLQLQKCSLSRFDDSTLKGKVLILCPMEHLVNATQALKDIVLKLNPNESGSYISAS